LHISERSCNNDEYDDDGDGDGDGDDDIDADASMRRRDLMESQWAGPDVTFVERKGGEIGGRYDEDSCNVVADDGGANARANSGAASDASASVDADEGSFVSKGDVIVAVPSASAALNDDLSTSLMSPSPSIVSTSVGKEEPPKTATVLMGVDADISSAASASAPA